MIIVFDEADQFIRRIDARQATLTPGWWELQDAVVTTASGLPQPSDTLSVATRLTLDNLQDSFASPETMSFWELPGFIKILENAGFSAVQHRLYFHAQLASPLLFTAMVLIAATFSLRLPYGAARWSGSQADCFSGFSCTSSRSGVRARALLEDPGSVGGLDTCDRDDVARHDEPLAPRGRMTGPMQRGRKWRARASSAQGIRRS